MNKPTPISRLPIIPKMEACIREGKSFNNLGSTLGTAIRWEGGFWILSTTSWRSRPNKVYERTAIDIAVGRKGERPFLIRPPYLDDPRAEYYYQQHWVFNNGNGRSVIEKIKAEVTDDLYASYIDRTMQRRLDALQCVTFMRKFATDTIINPKTKRKNKIRKNVYWLVCHGCARGKDLSINATPIPWEPDYHCYGDESNISIPHYNTKTGTTTYTNRVWHNTPNPIYNRFEVPLVKYGWYFSTTGQLAFESADPKFTIPDSFFKGGK